MDYSFDCPASGLSRICCIAANAIISDAITNKVRCLSWSMGAAHGQQIQAAPPLVKAAFYLPCHFTRRGQIYWMRKQLEELKSGLASFKISL
ncbi:hypothetical protein [Hydrogenophaga sp.]|uniref:hypothetical protein n=1 Tax=Hydrogenophaga sp. TaxID=1904254 RepID=UPI00272575A3|nr:hypothetical protein [Hydrogenophaga sp.]MDO9134222.1 hypothetical protein [Hydrogenophaga sp.]